MISLSKEYKILIENSDFSDKDQLKYFGIITTELKFRGYELYDAVITCGMPSFYLLKQTIKKRSYEIAYKIFLLNTILESDDKDYLIFSNKVKYLDSTEKVFLMYYIGMFITKLISKNIFKFDYLVHLGIVKQYKSISCITNKQPDFIGFNKTDNNYSIFEAKGRSRMDNRVFKYAKSQVGALKWVNGNKPLNGIVSAVYPYKNKLKCHLKDPEIIGYKEFDISKLELIWLYYEPFFAAFKEIQNYRYDFNKNPILKIISIDKNMQVKIEMNKDLYEFFDNFEENKEKKDSEEKLNKILENKKILTFDIISQKN